MSNLTHTNMHREHTAWRLEDNLWRDEIAMWESEIEQALSNLPRLEAALRAHADVLRQHAASIRLYAQEPAYHEHELTRFEQGESPSDLLQLARSHKHETENHAEQYKRHEEIKRRQHVFMTKWRLLSSALAEAEAVEPRPSERRIEI